MLTEGQLDIIRRRAREVHDEHADALLEISNTFQNKLKPASTPSIPDNMDKEFCEAVVSEIEKLGNRLYTLIPDLVQKLENRISEDDCRLVIEACEPTFSSDTHLKRLVAYESAITTYFSRFGIHSPRKKTHIEIFGSAYASFVGNELSRQRNKVMTQLLVLAHKNTSASTDSDSQHSIAKALRHVDAKPKMFGVTLDLNPVKNRLGSILISFVSWALNAVKKIK